MYNTNPSMGAHARNGFSVHKVMQYLILAMALVVFSSAAVAGKLNLNQADAQALQTIPGIGASKSAVIVEYREQIGGFKTLEQMLEVPGIGEKTLEQIREFGTLEGGETGLSDDNVDESSDGKTSATSSSSQTNS